MENKVNPLKDKSYKFDLRVVKLYKHLVEEREESFYKNLFEPPKITPGYFSFFVFHFTF